MPLSYRLHRELAKAHNGREAWGYRKVSCGQLTAKGRPVVAKESALQDTAGGLVSLQKRDKEALSKSAKSAGIPKDLDWFVPESLVWYEHMGGHDTTAQVHPYQFTTSVAQLAEEKGAKIILGSVETLQYDSNGCVQSVVYTDKATHDLKTISATTVILCAGPWTRSIYPSAPISALRAHSVTIRPSRPVSAYAIFTEIALPAGFGMTGDSTKKKGRSTKTVSPEIYARPNNEVYACGEGDTLIPLPTSSDLVQVDERRCQDVVDYVSSISDELRDGEVTARQACYLPNVTGPVGGPLIGETGVKGLLMATGHTCWGIQNGPATGKLISEFVFDGEARSAKIGNLDPRRFM